MEVRGLEPLAFWLQTRKPDSATTKRGNGLRLHGEALAAHLPHSPNQAAPDADLASIVEAWPELSPAVKAGILAMVKASKP